MRLLVLEGDAGDEVVEADEGLAHYALHVLVPVNHQHLRHYPQLWVGPDFVFLAGINQDVFKVKLAAGN